MGRRATEMNLWSFVRKNMKKVKQKKSIKVDDIKDILDSEQEDYEDSRLNDWSFPDYVGDSWGDKD